MMPYALRNSEWKSRVSARSNVPKIRENSRRPLRKPKNTSPSAYKMKLVKLAPETDLTGFDCGDEDLNGFLVEDAKGFLDKRIATSYILEDEENIVAYFCLLNDKISRQDVTNSQWKKIKGVFPERKQFGSYPAIKIGRFAVSSDYKGRNIGTDLMNLLKLMLNDNPNYSAFRYLTVDAYLSAIDFYRKNGFKVLSEKIVNDHTRLMFFDMMELE